MQSRPVAYAQPAVPEVWIGSSGSVRTAIEMSRRENRLKCGGVGGDEALALGSDESTVPRAHRPVCCRSSEPTVRCGDDLT